MYLKELEINGFKSFAKKSDLIFTTSISGIVGPNGSGKSNVAEAFRFVLGEQSIKNMRGKKGEDLIFTGAAGRSQRGAVKVVFDNSSKTLDIDYKEVSIQRIVSRDGSNEYLINGSKVRAKDIQELLSAANIGASGHHIISQGEADKILSINPKERKGVIEEALGLKAFTMRKNEAERKLARTDDNLKEVLVEQRSVAPRISYLKREVDKIEKARSMKEELRILYKLYFPTKKRLQDELSVQTQHIEKLNQEVEQINAEVRALQEKLTSVTSTEGVEAKTQELVKVEKELQVLKGVKAEKEREIGKTDARIEIATEEKKRYDLYLQQQEEHTSLESLSAAVHDMWVKWAQELMETETLSQERTKRWSALLVPYAELPESEKEKDRIQAREITAVLDEEESVRIPEFDELKLGRLNTEREALHAEIEKLSAQEVALEQKRDELDDVRDSSETVGQKVQIEILTIEKKKSEILGILNGHKMKAQQVDAQVQAFNIEEAAARGFFGQETDSFFVATDTPGEPEMNVKDKITRLKVLLENGNLGSSGEITEEYNKLVEHKQFIDEQVQDLKATQDSLNELISELADQIEVKFREGLEKINSAFARFFQTLFSGGRAEIFVTEIPIKKQDEDDPQEYEIGVDLSVSLPNKKIRGMSMLSGGERSLTSIALLFAMSSVTPPPFIILDETDAALDEANSKRYGDMIELLSKESQLILITHNRETMSRAGILYGVTMGSDGASRLLSISLEQGEQFAK